LKKKYGSPEICFIRYRQSWSPAAAWDPSRWAAEAVTRTPAQEAALNFDVAIRSRQIMPAHPDPADRFLVATALIYDLTLVTADATLIDARACRLLAN
jgi:PIN domain nuclease of toxin-antitoxin system